MQTCFRVMPVGFYGAFAAVALVVTTIAAPLAPPDLTTLKPVGLLAKPGDFSFADATNGPARATFGVLPDVGSGLAFRAEIPARGKSTYDIQALLKTVGPVKRGDVVLARFQARAPVARQESGEGALSFAFQRAVPPLDKSVVLTVSPGPEWSVFEIPFTVVRDFAAGEAVVALSFGDLSQTIEIAGLEILNFGSRARLDQLPRTRFTYQGRGADAAWRKAALKRIEEIRTAPLTIRVTDANGRPLTGARVEAQLIQAEFVWGTSVNEALLANELPDSANYRRVLGEFFNTAVIENGLKWPTWDRSPARQAETRRAFDWLEQQGFRQKGHNLVWPGWKFTPKFARETADRDPAAFQQLITEQLRQKVEFTKGRVFAWDVVNEPVHERDFFKVMPEAAIADWFKLARSIDPAAQLYLNEYGMLNSALSPDMITRVRAMIKELRAAGAPVDGVGIQGHVGQQPRAPLQVLSDLDLIAAEGLPVQITEFDVNSPDEELQADYTRDFLIACYSHPAISGFIMWGFWQPKHWKPDAAMFRADWSEKPNAAVWREWVRGVWNTRLDTTTQADGTASARGHRGHYRVSVTHHGVVIRRDLTLDRTGAELWVRFP